MERLPREVLEEILKDSPAFTRFTVAISSKALYEKIRHVPLKNVYNIHSKDGPESIGSFFFSSVIHVNVIIDDTPLNYENLKNMLEVFYCVHSISITGHMTQTTARKIIASLPMSPLVVDLKLYCNTYVGPLLKNSLITSSKRAIVIIDDELQRKKRKAEPVTFKTPSPLKDVLRPLKVAYETSKLELCKVMSLEQKSDDVHAPAALINQRFINNSEYTNLNTNGLNSFELSDDFTLDELNTKIIKISEKLIESVIQFDNHWFFITEFEIYVRNRSYIDDCAQESWWLMYPGKLEVYLVKKNEKGNSWFEISMFWDRLEFLVTGGLRGNYSDGVVTPFLGSSQTALYPLNVSTNIKTTNVLVRKEGTKTNQTTRKLRQYNKISAKQKWLFRSSKFVRKGFYTTVPLDVHSNYIKTNMASVASFLLSKIVEKEFKEDDTQHVFKLLADTSLFSSKKTEISLNLLKRDYQKLNLPASQQVIIKCFINLAEGRMDKLLNDDIMALSKGTLNSFCKNEDEKKLRRNVHLL